MWTKKQKGVVHQYSSAARLTDDEYRGILEECTGCRTAAAARLTHDDYAAVMAAIEGRLERAISEGILTLPDHGKIRDLSYWRKKLPGKRGMVTSRQLRAIGLLMAELRPMFPDNPMYIQGIIRQAIKKQSDVLDLTSAQASKLIDALKSRLSHGGGPS